MSLNNELHAELKNGHKLDDTTLTHLYDLFEMHQDKKEAVRRLYTLAFNRGCSNNDYLTRFNYENLQTSVREITEVLYIVHDWLNCCPETSEEARITLIHEHNKHFALMNLIMKNLSDLVDEHIKINKEMTA